MLGNNGAHALAFGLVQVSEPAAKLLAQRVQVQAGFWAGWVAGVPVAAVLAKQRNPKSQRASRAVVRVGLVVGCVVGDLLALFDSAGDAVAVDDMGELD